MSTFEPYDPKGRFPPIDEGLLINTRLNEIERQQREERAEEKVYKATQLKFNRLTVIFTALLFITSAVSDWIMIRQTAIASDSAKAANSAAQTARDTLELMTDSSDITTAQVDRLIEEQKRAATAIDNSLGQSKASLEISIRALQIDQRPWLRIDLGEYNPDPNRTGRVPIKFQAGRPLEIPIRFTNSGKTPALDIKAAVIVEIVRVGNDPDIPSGKLGIETTGVPIPKGGFFIRHMAAQGMEASIIHPGNYAELVGSRMQLLINGDMEVTTLTPQEVVDLNLGSKYLAFWGEIWYTDIFRNKHWMTFCQNLGSQSKKCSAHNYVDQ